MPSFPVRWSRGLIIWILHISIPVTRRAWVRRLSAWGLRDQCVARDQAAACFVQVRGGFRPVFRRTTAPPANRPYRLLPHAQHHLARPVGTCSGVGHRGLDRAVKRRRGAFVRLVFRITAARRISLTMLDAYDWDFCQIQYNYAGERYQAGTAGLMAAAERGLAVFVMEPLLGGRLGRQIAAAGARCAR